jgi:putative membrane protein
MRINHLLSLAAVAVAPVLAQSSNSLSATDREFVDRAAQISMTEAHLGKMAQSQGQDQSVKDYGQTLVTDHTDAYNRLSNIAQSHGYTIPKSIDQEHQTEIQSLQNLSGLQLDQKFRDTEVQDHQQALSWFRSQEQSLQNPDLKSYASDMAATIEKHLNLAQNLGASGGQTAASNMSNSQPGMTPGAMQGHMMDNPMSAQQEANRMRNPNAGISAETHYGTITKYEPGKMVELKVRDRLGRHVYDLAGDNIAADVTPDLKVGDQVAVTEHVDANGRASIQIQRDAGTGAASRMNQ